MELLFPRTVNRVQYLIRWAIFFIVAIVITVLGGALAHGDDAAPSMISTVLILALAVLKIFSMDIPRLRHIGWSPWSILFLLVPLVNLIFQILLFVMPRGSRRYR